MPKKSRSDQPQFWEDIYRKSERLPWDAGGVPPSLREFIDEEKEKGRVLIPGCGSAYEARAFADTGWDVTAIDFAPAAVERARKIFGTFSGQIHVADFFKLRPRDRFDIIYERAFLCALPRERWAEYGPRMAELLKRGGRLVGFFFYKNNRGGPPFGLKEGQLQDILGSAFKRLKQTTVPSTKEVFGETESFEIWEHT